MHPPTSDRRVLYETQAALVDAVIGVAKADTPIAVVLVHGGGLAVEGLVAAGRVAILDAFYPGPAGGGAIADALFGVYNPGGKLPYTVYRSEYVQVGGCCVCMNSSRLFATYCLHAQRRVSTLRILRLRLWGGHTATKQARPHLVEPPSGNSGLA